MILKFNFCIMFSWIVSSLCIIYNEKGIRKSNSIFNFDIPIILYFLVLRHYLVRQLTGYLLILPILIPPVSGVQGIKSALYVCLSWHLTLCWLFGHTEQLSSISVILAKTMTTFPVKRLEVSWAKISRNWLNISHIWLSALMLTS